MSSTKKSLKKKITPSKKLVAKKILQEDSDDSDNLDNFQVALGSNEKNYDNSSSDYSEEEEEEINTKWGSKSYDYYGQPKSQDEETKKKLNQQLEKKVKQASANLRPEDFDDIPTKKRTPKKEKTNNSNNTSEEVDFKLDIKYDHLTKDEKMDLLKEEFPELLEFLKEFQQKIKELKYSIQPTLELVKEKKKTTGGISFLQVKFQLLLSYLMNLNFYFILKLSGFSVKDHPVIEDLAKIRVIMERMKPIDLKLQSQIDSLLRIASLGTSALGNSELRHKPNLAALEEDSSDENYENQNNKYIVSKSSSMPFLDEKKQKKEAQKISKLKSKISKSSMMKYLQNQYSENPEELPQIGATFDDEQEDLEEKERQQYEEEFFVRLPRSKKDLEKKKKKSTTSTNFFDTLPSYNQIAVLDNFGKKKLEKEREEVVDTADMLRQRFGAIPEDKEFDINNQFQKKKRKVEYENLGPDERRKVSKNILNDQGHTRQRNKETKNSKTKLRKKYSKAISKRNSMIRPLRSQTGSYSGENRISSHIVRSKAL